MCGVKAVSSCAGIAFALCLHINNWTRLNLSAALHSIAASSTGLSIQHPSQLTLDTANDASASACVVPVVLFQLSVAAAANPEEIELGDDDDDDEDNNAGAADDDDEGGGGSVQEKAVPAAVFGSLAAAAAGGQQQQQQADEEPVGALERFKKRRVE